jgi:hypothetical protein
MIEPSFGASLVAAGGAVSLPAAGFSAAVVAAVTLSPIAVPADPEDCMPSDRRTNALTKKHLAMPIHVRPRQGWTMATDHGKLKPVCQTERPDRANGPGIRCVPACDEELYQWQC